MIRPMSEQDLDAALAIEQAVQAYPWSRGNFVDAINCGYLCYADEIAGEFAGFAVLMPGVGEAELLNIAVASAHQRRGLGRSLLGAMFEVAAARSMSRIYLEVCASNLAAIALYRICGFEQIGLRRGYYRNRDGSEDALVMACDIVGEQNGQE